MENRFNGSDKSLNAKVSESYDQEVGNFLIDEKSLGEVELVDKLDLVRKRSWFRKAMRELGVEKVKLLLSDT